MTIQEYFQANGYDAHFKNGQSFRAIIDIRNLVKKVRVLKPLALKEGDIFTVNTTKYQVLKELVNHPGPVEVGTYQISLVFN